MAYDTPAEKVTILQIFTDLNERQATMTDAQKWQDNKGLAAVTGDLGAAVKNWATRVPGTGRGSGKS